jgi:hypothetical protein
MDGKQSVDITFRVAHAICCLEVGNPPYRGRCSTRPSTLGIDAIPHDLFRSTTLLGYSILALDLEDAAAAAVLLPAIEPFVDEVSYNGVTSQGPVAAYVGKLLTLVGRHDEAEAVSSRPDDGRVLRLGVPPRVDADRAGPESDGSLCTCSDRRREYAWGTRAGCGTGSSVG